MIDYLVPDFFAHLSTEHSGGMHTKVDIVSRRRYNSDTF